MKELLSNEERLRRLRERWARQAADRREPGAEFKAYPTGRAFQRRSGVRDYAEKIISPQAMAVAERYFWQRCGFATPPVTAAGVFGGAR